MKELTKAQLAVGFLAYFATIWGLVLNQEFLDKYPDVVNAIGIIFFMCVSP